jgi:hypothetical protein
MTSRAKTFAKRAALGCGAIFALLIIAVTVLIIVGPPNDYEGTPSIEAEATYQDAALLEEAWALPVARLYHEELTFQENGSTCGPASTANILKSLGDEDDTEDEVLEGSGLCWTGMCFMGLTLDEVASVARAKTDAQITVLRDVDIATFREHLRASNDPARRYLINFHRGPLFGRGGGHHSPIAGYLEERDLVLVFDVNEEYRPWLVESARLFEAMDTVDSASGQKRGLLLFEP